MRENEVTLALSRLFKGSVALPEGASISVSYVLNQHYLNYPDDRL
jgi:hypothetical protein